MKFEKRSDAPAEAQPAAKEDAAKSPAKREASVLIYTVVLFVVALALIALSYMIQQRNTNDTINNLTEQHGEIQSQALRNIEELQNTNLALREENEQLRLQIEDLRRQLEETQEELTGLRDRAEDAERDQTQLQGEKDALELALEEHQKTIEAIEKLLVLIQEGPTEEGMAEMEPLAQYLDEPYTTYYQDLVEMMNGDVEP